MPTPIAHSLHNSPNVGIAQDGRTLIVDKIATKSGRRLNIVDGFPGGLQVVATRGAWPGLLEGGSASNYTRMESECSMQIGPSNCTGLRPVYTNKYMDNSTAETNGPNSYTLESALRIPPSDGLPSIPFFFRNGTKNPVVEAGTPFIIADPMGVNVAKNTRIRIRSGAIVASGDKVPGGMKIKGSNEQMTSSTAGSSQVYNSSTFATPGGGAVSTNYAGFMPVCMLGVPRNAMPALAIIGDSISTGASDGNDGNYNSGFIERACWNVFADGSPLPYTNLSRNGDGMFYVGNSTQAYRLTLLQYHTDVLIALGINDIAGRTHVQMLADLDVYIQKAQDAGCRVHVMLLTPKTNAGNSAVFSADFNTGGKRDLYNQGVVARLASGAIDGILNVNTVLESQVTYGLWANSAFTSDGLHPITLGNTTAEPVARAYFQANIRDTF